MKERKTPETARQRKRLTVFGVEFVYLYVLGIVMAFLGWIVENAARLISIGVWDCRFHLLPFLSPYALIVFAVQIVFGNPDRIAPFGRPLFHRETPACKICSNLITLAVIYFFVFFGELVVGNLWEILFGVSLWNYSAMPLHVTQYAGLISTLGYGTGVYLLFRFAYTPALKLIRSKMKYRTALLISSTLGVLIVLDTAIMIVYTIVMRQPPMYWSIRLHA
ncbi:MAG: hypothetical protein ACI4U2_00090 [Christensenellaceae bacterium]